MKTDKSNIPEDVPELAKTRPWEEQYDIPDNPESFLNQMKNATGMDLGDLTTASRASHDPLHTGKNLLDWKQAAWGAWLWEKAVEDRQDDRIYIRGLHYWAYAWDRDIPTPNPKWSNDSRSTDWDIYGNSDPCAQYINKCVNKSRELGLIPYSGIIDEKTEVDYRRNERMNHSTPGQESVGNVDLMKTPHIPHSDFDINPACLRYDKYRSFVKDRWRSDILDDLYLREREQHKFHIEVWSEKTLPSEIVSAMKEAGADAVVDGQGCMSKTQVYEFAENLQEVGKPAIILYLADFDPQGHKMPVQILPKIKWQKEYGVLNQQVYVDRLAITKEQIEKHNLPRKPIEKGTEDEVQDWESKHGAGVTELNALEANLENFKGIVTNEIRRYRDETLPERNDKAKKNYGEIVDGSINFAIDGSINSVEDDVIDEIESFNEEYEKYLDAAESAHESLEKLLGSDPYNDLQKNHMKTRNNLYVPDIDIPESRVEAPENPLYDSEESYIDMLARVREYEGET